MGSQKKYRPGWKIKLSPWPFGFRFLAQSNPTEHKHVFCRVSALDMQLRLSRKCPLQYRYGSHRIPHPTWRSLCMLRAALQRVFSLLTDPFSVSAC